MSNIAEIVLQSDCIFTAAGEAPFAGYVAVSGGRIAAVGKGECPAGLKGASTRVYELGDRTVSPGFTDVHCFFTGYSVGFVGADCSAAKSCVDLVAIAREQAKRTRDGHPILGHGWDPETIRPEGTALLDEAFGDRPVVLFAEGRETCWMNAAAQKAYRFTPETCCRRSSATDPSASRSSAGT